MGFWAQKQEDKKSYHEPALIMLYCCCTDYCYIVYYMQNYCFPISFRKGASRRCSG